MTIAPLVLFALLFSPAQTPAQTAKPAPPIPASARLAMFVVAQVRQALQHTAAIGACSPYLLVACTIRLCQTAFMVPV